MRSLALAFALAFALGGCVLPKLADLAAPEPQWALACGRANASWHQDCLTKVSDSPRTKAETWIDISPTDPKTLLVGVKDMDPAKSNACVWVSYYATHDGGASWSDVTPNGKYAARAPSDPSFGWACNTDPMQAFTSDGSVHAIVEMYAQGKSVNTQLSLGTRFELYNSKDGGASWSSHATMIAGDGFALGPDYTRMVVNPKTQTLVTTFIDFTAGRRCYVVAMRGGGTSADPPVTIPAPNSIGCQVAAASPDGTITVGGLDNLDGAAEPKTFFALSTDDAKSFSQPFAGFSFKVVQSSIPKHQAYTGTGFELRYAQDGPHKGTLYATTNENTTDGPRVVVRKSLDHGKTWGAPLRVGNGSGAQSMVNMAIAGDGSLHAFFFDQRYDPDGLVDITHAWSVDDGASWREERVTNASFDPDTGRHQDGGTWIGDYVGVACGPADCWASFPDSSLGGEPVLAVAHGHRTP